MFIAWTWPFDIFINSTKEDHLIEWLQFFVLFIGSIISFRLALKKYFQNQKYHAFWFLLWSLMFFLVAGDEISWGIRLLGLEVPELVAQQNRQDDFTFHNLFVFEWIVFWGYLSIAFFGFFSRQICSIGKSFSALLKFFHPYTPSYYLLGYWLLPLIFWGYHLFAVIGIWRFWSEPAELFIYAGLVLWILDDRPVS